MGKRKRSGSFSKYDDCSKKSDDGDSQEELDGDSVVAHKGNIANGIRYSARVQEKQEKLRRESSPSKQIFPESTTSIATVSIPCPITTVKVFPTGEETADAYPLEQAYISQSISISGEKKKKRTWELWSQEDKQLFFEALNEFGKDFDAIQNYLASKLKPRSKGSCSQAVPKNKDQVRHFYYRTWNKISKFLTFPKDMKKAYQELYGLINYGELRKKQRVLNLKTAVKLSELVDKGTSTIKVRGKTFRIKTPVCRALKKLNQLEDTDQIRVPCKLCVELVPLDGDTWTAVQRVSHNPRVKIFAPLQRTLSSLIIYFEERWKTDENRLKEEFSLTVFGKPRTRLRFFPVESRDLSVPMFKFSEVTSATKISLSAYVQNCLYQERSQVSAMVSKKFKRKPKIDLDSGNTTHRDADYLAAEADVSDVDGCEAILENQFRITLRRDKYQTGQLSSGMKTSEFCTDQDNSNGLDNALWAVHEENANAAAETDAGETDYGFDENAPSPTECDENTGDEDCMDHVIADNPMPDNFHDLDGKEEKPNSCTACKCLDAEENVGTEKPEKVCTCGSKRTLETESIRCQVLDSETMARGWNADEAGALTLGEIYLMLGKSDKLCFEYTWDKCEEDRLREERTRNLVDKLVSIARQLKKKKTNRAKTSTTPLPISSAIVCSKCNHKIESPGGADNELPLNSASVIAKDGSSEHCQGESPPRTASILPIQNENSDDNKITLHAVVSIDSSSANEFCLPRNDAIATDASSKSESLETVTLHSELDISPGKKGDVSSTQVLNPSDSIISTPIPDTNSSKVCSNQQSLVTPQTGVIEISTLTPTTSLPVDVDCNFRRVTPNIQAAVIPSSTAIIRSVSLTNTAVPEASISSIGGISHCGTLTPVATTTAVLVSEPAIFAGMATDVAPFVTLQQCSAASVSPPPTQNTQETKFRRPADVPILMKPSSDDRSTNEDGSVKLNVPKPFLDLPKGNRRIGRRPAWKQRVIIPRMLPLLPKPDATMTTLISIPPVVATGLSVIPVTAENLNPIATIPVSSDMDINPMSTALVSKVEALSTNVTVAVTSVLTPLSTTLNVNTTVTSALMSGAVASGSGATNCLKGSGSLDLKVSSTALSMEKSSPSKNSLGFEETLDSLSLSSFMDISIPESTRFIANDLRFDELDNSNSSVNLSGILDETSRKNSRDPSLLETPKKQSGSDDISLDSDAPEKLTLASLDAWSAMNEGMDFSMGSLFNGNEGLRTNSNESLSGVDLTFQSVIGDGSLDFESKLNDFTTSLSDRNNK